MTYSIIQISVHLCCVGFSFFALSSLKFEKFCDVRNPYKVRTLLILLSMGLGYLVAQFLLALTIYNGL